MCAEFGHENIRGLGSGFTFLAALSGEAIVTLALVEPDLVSTRTAIETRLRQAFIDLCKNRKWRHLLCLNFSGAVERYHVGC